MSDTAPVSRPRERVEFERERGVTEVTVHPNLTHVTVRFPLENLPARRLQLLHDLAKSAIPIFLVKLQTDGLSFAVRESHIAACEERLAAAGCDFRLSRDLALVSTIAGAMRDLSGVIAQIYEALISAHVRVRQTGDAYNAVLVLVAGDEADRAAVALRERFSLEGETA